MAWEQAIVSLILFNDHLMLSLLFRRNGKLLLVILDKSHIIKIIKEGNVKNQLRQPPIKIYRFKRMRRLPSNCREKRRNNLRDQFCCITTLTNRARECRYKIGNNLLPNHVARSRIPLLLILRSVRELVKKKLA
jgi:hypothetical protein